MLWVQYASLPLDVSLITGLPLTNGVWVDMTLAEVETRLQSLTWTSMYPPKPGEAQALASHPLPTCAQELHTQGKAKAPMTHRPVSKKDKHLLFKPLRFLRFCLMQHYCDTSLVIYTAETLSHPRVPVSIQRKSVCCIHQWQNASTFLFWPRLPT